MPSYIFPKKNAEFVLYIGLVSQADTKVFQANPTIAAGDFKVSTDGSALANPATLPSVDPASSKAVKVTLSAAEMNGDNIQLIASDAAGAEWCDAFIQIQTSARQVDDLAFPTVSGRGLDVTAGGNAGIDWANVEGPTTSVTLSGTTVGTATDLGAAAKTAVHAEMVTALNVDNYAEPTGAPGASVPLSSKIGRLYQSLRNKGTATATLKVFYDDAGGALWSKVTSDAAGTYTEEEGS